MNTVLKINGFNRIHQVWENVATNPAAPAKLSYKGAGVFRETLCATKNAEKLLKGVDLNEYSCLNMIIDGVKVACKNNVNSPRWQFVKAGGLF